MRIVKLDPKTWIRGQGAYNSRLLTTYGKRCCLGFDAAACGISDRALLEKGMPQNVILNAQGAPEFRSTWLRPLSEKVRKQLPPKATSSHTHAGTAAAHLNDSREINDTTRLFYLNIIGAEVGVQFVLEES